MATLSKILRWVTATVLDRTQERDEIPRGADLAAWQPNCPDAAQAESREAVAAMRLIGPDAEWTRDPLSAPDAPDAPDMPPVEDWRWQAMDGYEWKAMEVALRERIGADVDAVLATLESLGAIVRRPRPVFAAGLCKRAGEAVRGVFVWEAPEVHQRWLDLPEEDRPRHPLAPIIAAWLDRPRQWPQATVTAAGGMTRRPVSASHVRMLRWEVDTVAVDGVPMVARMPDTAAAFDPDGTRAERMRKWAVYRPGEQGCLPFRGLAPLPVDLRLASLAGLDGVLSGDVLMLLTIAETLDRPMELDKYTGARLLARTRSGDFRAPKASDIRRFWNATEALYDLKLFDPSGTGRWANLAHVEPIPQAKQIIIGPPAWRHFGRGNRYTLTAEGGIAARDRLVVGRKGAGGRLITGIEYALGARYLGERGIASSLRPANGKIGPGPVIDLPLPTVGMVMGEDDPRTDEPARKRIDRAIEAAMPKYRSGPGPNATAPAGDSVEIIDRTRGSRGRHAALRVRASARFVEAAQIAARRDGRGFKPLALADWIGVDLT